MDETMQTQPAQTTEPAKTDVESIVKAFFEQGVEVGEIMTELKKMYDEQKLTEDEFKQAVALANQMDKEMASQQFGVNIL